MTNKPKDSDTSEEASGCNSDSAGWRGLFRTAPRASPAVYAKSCNDHESTESMNEQSV